MVYFNKTYIMKLKEVLDTIFEHGPHRFGNDEYFLSHRMLELLHSNLLACDEFKDVNSLTIMTEPSIIIDDKTLTAVTMKLPNEYVFSGDVRLYSISLTPPIYDPTIILEPVKDGCSITPFYYNPITFEPYKKIILEYVTEEPDGSPSNRMLIHDLLDKILDKPEEYTPKGLRGIMIRGLLL